MFHGANMPHKEEARPLKENDILGNRYFIRSILGEGGTSTVYLCGDLKLMGKNWVVKEVKSTAETAEQFIAEAKILARLDHPNLPKIADYFPPDRNGFSYLVMEYMQGLTLQEMFEQNGYRLPTAKIVKYALQLSDLLQYLHEFPENPIIYRDLKPANVIIDVQDTVQLIDFGIARDYKSGKIADTVQIGTIGFAAPEQFAGLQTDHRTDLFSLGATIYYLASGGKYHYTTQKPLSEVSAGVSDDFARIVERLLMSDPEERYQSAAQLKRDLSGLQETLPEQAPLFCQADSFPALSELPSRKLIVVGGLYPGAGATFAAVALARLLNDCQILHSVVEFPGNEPDLYTLLFGDQNAPRGYQFVTDELLAKGTASGCIEWKDGFTAWMPLNPEGMQEQWNGQLSYKLIYEAKTSVILLDIADRWLDPDVREICDNADELVFVADGSPVALQRPKTLRNIKQLEKWIVSGKSVNLIANKAPAPDSRKRWLDVLPIHPRCIVPYFTFETTSALLWRRKLVQDDPLVKEQLSKALLPLIKHLFPGQKLKLKSEREKKFFSSWLN